VDVWNVHNFIIKEDCNDFGADVPPGYTGLIQPSIGAWYDTAYNNPCRGTLYHEVNGVQVGDQSHDNMEIFDAQIRAFRKWMKEHGQKEKPLIVSEYGFVYEHILEDPVIPGADSRNQTRITNFMLLTFDYFLNTKDADLGYSADDDRLVQRWAWFGLDTLYDFNAHGLTPRGTAFSDWTRNH